MQKSHLHLWRMVAVVNDRYHGKPFQLPRKQNVIQDIEENSRNPGIQDLQEDGTLSENAHPSRLYTACKYNMKFCATKVLSQSQVEGNEA